MGWLSFVLVLTVARDILLLAIAALPLLAPMQAWLDAAGTAWVPIGALAVLASACCPR